MVLGLLTVASIPTVIGVGQAVSAQKKQNAASREQEKFHIVPETKSGQELGNGAFCALVNNKLWLDLADNPVEGHRFCGYHFRYPGEEQLLGMVSTIADDPPMLNWLYVNKNSRSVAYGGRKDTIGHVIGPWGWTEDCRFVTLRGDAESFVAVEEDYYDGTGKAAWAVYWDPDGGLQENLGQEQCWPVMLRRKPLMGMESRYVRD